MTRSVRLGCVLALLACSPSAPIDEGPRHVVLVSLDALGARHVGAYGYARETTPRLDALAREGVLFEKAYTQQVWTLTSHITMLSGLHPQAHGASQETPAREGIPHLARILSAAGFETAAFVGAGGYLEPRFGLGRGFGRYEILPQPAHIAQARRAEWLAEQAARAEEDPGHRFFLFTHYYDVHSDVGTRYPYASPPEYRERFWPEGLDWPRRGDTRLLDRLQKEGASEDDRRAIAALYDAGVRYCDEHCLGSLLDQLASLGLAEDTLLIVTSDHGEEIYEHGMCSHQQPYEETSRVPLVVRGPGVARGRRSAMTAQHVDLLPTVLSLLGLPVPEAAQGIDLGPWLAAESEPAPPAPRDAFVDGILGGLPHVYWRYPSAIVSEDATGRFALVAPVDHPRRGDGHDFALAGPGELYDLRADPEQQHDLRAAQPQRAARLAEKLLDWYRRNEAIARPDRAGPRPMLDEAERARLRALGYVHERGGEDGGGGRVGEQSGD